MKKIKVIALTLPALVMFSCQKDLPGVVECGEKDVPEVVVNSFKTEFPNATQVEWKKSEAIIEVEFEFNNEDKEAEYDNDGNLLEVETELTDTKQLPEGVLAYISKNYPNYEIEEAELVNETEKGQYYEVVIELEDENENNESNENEAENENEDDENEENENDDDDDDDDEDKEGIELVFDEKGNFIEQEKE